MFLTKCTQPLAPTAVDLRGWWKDPKQPDYKGERIEQCGLRIIITAAGVIHDTYIADGTLNNGVKDVSYFGCSPINVAGRFDKSKNAFTFYDSDDKMIVTRTRLNATHMKFVHPLLGTVYYIKQTRKPGTEN